MTEEPRDPEPDDTAPTEPLSSGDPSATPRVRPQSPTLRRPRRPGVRRLTRSSSDKLIGGVAGGLGRYFGVDPILFRIAFVVLTFAGGVGVLAYIGLLAFVPADDDSRVFGNRRDANMIGAVLLGLIVVLLPRSSVLLHRAGADPDRDPDRDRACCGAPRAAASPRAATRAG